MRSLDAGQITQQQAAEQMRLSVRQVRRIYVRFREQGDEGLLHRSRGQPSNRRIPDEVRAQAIALLESEYHDFGPTLAAEKLGERNGLQVSKETVRKWMIEVELYKPKSRKPHHRSWREPKECFGELIQVDGSEHNWFGESGPKVVLLATVDDATKRLFCRFAVGETTEEVMALLRDYIRASGRPLAIYADLHSIYRTTRGPSLEEQLEGQQPETQMARALRELDIAYIPSYSPQGKGRIERTFKTLQDRLVKDLRLQGISDIHSANRFLKEHYIKAYNGQFVVEPASPADAHRSAEGFDLDAILSNQESRTVTNDYTISYYNTRYQITRESATPGLRGAKVIVEKRLNGSIKVRFRGGYLKVTELPPAAPKAHAQTQPKPRRRRTGTSVTPAADHPWRRDFRRLPNKPSYP
jgi:hypothetical protein